MLSELGRQEPGFKEITDIIEHDLNLSYSLLKLVNSAYIAPRFKVKTISQAITILGLNEMTAFVSSVMLMQIQSPDNIELLRLSLIRGKFMDLLAGARDIRRRAQRRFLWGCFH